MCFLPFDTEFDIDDMLIVACNWVIRFQFCCFLRTENAQRTVRFHSIVSLFFGRNQREFKTGIPKWGEGLEQNWISQCKSSKTLAIARKTQTIFKQVKYLWAHNTIECALNPQKPKNMSEIERMRFTNFTFALKKPEICVNQWFKCNYSIRF